MSKNEGFNAKQIEQLTELLSHQLSSQRVSIIDEIDKRMDARFIEEREITKKMMDERFIEEREITKKMIDERFIEERATTRSIIREELQEINDRLDKLETKIENDLQFTLDAITDLRKRVAVLEKKLA